jgi:hypothetical protein
MRRIPASSSQHSNTAIPKSPADLALLQANSIKTMHPRPDPPPSRLHKTLKFTLVACLSVACLSVRLSPDCRRPVCPSVTFPTNAISRKRNTACLYAACLYVRMPPTGCGLHAHPPAAYLPGACLLPVAISIFLVLTL